jgi:hypothetical protein
MRFERNPLNDLPAALGAPWPAPAVAGLTGLKAPVPRRPAVTYTMLDIGIRAGGETGLISCHSFSLCCLPTVRMRRQTRMRRLEATW